MAKIIYKGSAKPDDPIYSLGLVVSGRTTKPSSKDTAPKPETKPEDKASPEPHAQAKPESPVGDGIP